MTVAEMEQITEEKASLSERDFRRILEDIGDGYAAFIPKDKKVRDEWTPVPIVLYIGDIHNAPIFREAGASAIEQTIGTLRTGLYNYLHNKSEGKKVPVRLEDGFPPERHEGTYTVDLTYFLNHIRNDCR